MEVSLITLLYMLIVSQFIYHLRVTSKRKQGIYSNMGTLYFSIRYKGSHLQLSHPIHVRLHKLPS